MKIKVQGKPKTDPYAIDVRRGILQDAGVILRRRWPESRIFILTNRTVHALWYKQLEKSLIRAGIKGCPIVIRDGERFKNAKTYHEVISRMIGYRADRQSVLVCFGGGVIGDLGGYVAATYMRGIDLVHIPTTLIAQIDSSIGGKVALDHQQAKNLIGCFFNPRLVLTDPDVLATLNQRDLLNGLFEAVKIALVGNKQLYDFMQKNLFSIQSGHESIISQLVRRCIREKVKIVSRDPYDRGQRIILNFGHTLGHALETAEKYKGISHGVAVGWGMLLALRISEVLGYYDSAGTQEISELISGLLGKKQLGKISSKTLWKTILLDKKSQDGAVRFVLLKSVGQPVVERIDRQTFTKALEAM